MSETRTAVPSAGVAAPWRLDDRVALVTGASAGLGARFARVLHQAGAQVLATARRADLLDQLARECGERIDVMPWDIADASHRQALATRLASRGGLDVLVNNAGICDDGPIEQQILGRAAPGDRGQPDQRAGPVPADNSCGHERMIVDAQVS